MNVTMEQAMAVFNAYVDREKREKVERFRHLNRFVRRGQTVLAGSSLMEQFPFYEFAQTEALPCPVYNRGIESMTSAEMLENLGPCILDLEPGRLFLNIGTNDLNGPEPDVEGTLANIRAIVRRVKESLPTCGITLLAFYPVNPAVATEASRLVLRYRTNDLIRAVNERICALAAEEDVRFADLNAGLVDDRGALRAEFSIDGLHMYADGYRVVLGNLLPLLAEAYRCGGRSRSCRAERRHVGLSRCWLGARSHGQDEREGRRGHRVAARLACDPGGDPQELLRRAHA